MANNFVHTVGIYTLGCKVNQYESEAIAEYTEQTFNIDETAFDWKKMPPLTFIAREQKSMPGFKGQPDSLLQAQ